MLGHVSTSVKLKLKLKYLLLFRDILSFKFPLIPLPQRIWKTSFHKNGII